MRKLLIISVLLSFSCKKKEIEPVKKEEEKKLTQSELLVKQPWKLVDKMVSPGDSSIYKDIAACDKDNFYEYTKANIFILNEGAIKCFAGNPQIDSTSNWRFSNDSLFIRYNISPTDSFIEKYKIITLDENQLLLKSMQKVGAKTYIYETKYVPEN